MARKRASVGTPATLALRRAGIDFEVRTYRHDATDGAYGVEAARALGVPEARVFKTLLADTDRGLVVAVLPVSDRLDLKYLAAAAGVKKASMADPAAAERSSGYVVGGISPVGQRTLRPTVLDLSAQTFTSILVSGGRRGLDLELSPDDLVRVTGATWATVTRQH